MNRGVRIALVALGCLIYLRSPFDLIPDVAGPIGLLDDLLVLAVALWWVMRAGTRAGARPARDGPRSRSGRARSDQRRRAAAAPDDASPGAEVPWDPWSVLGVARGSSPPEIQRAYREQLKLYHPDRVADLGHELQEVAHRKVIEIRRAYEEIGGS